MRLSALLMMTIYLGTGSREMQGDMVAKHDLSWEHCSALVTCYTPLDIWPLLSPHHNNMLHRHTEKNKPFQQSLTLAKIKSLYRGLRHPVSFGTAYENQCLTPSHDPSKSKARLISTNKVLKMNYVWLSAGQSSRVKFNGKHSKYTASNPS